MNTNLSSKVIKITKLIELLKTKKFEINHINNTEFISGDVENTLDELINGKKIVPDVIMIDPPRKGIDNKSIENILKGMGYNVVNINFK